MQKSIQIQKRINLAIEHLISVQNIAELKKVT